MKVIKSLPDMVLILCLQCGFANAATIFMAPTGSDSNNGSSGSPVATIMKAQSLASAGDTVIINPGTYNVAPVINSVQDGVYAVVNLINKNGITYEAAGGTRPVLDFSGITDAGKRIVAFWVTASGVTFQGFDVVGLRETINNVNNQSVGFAGWGCKSCTWNQVNVHDGECVGFYFEEVAANNLVYRCDSYNNTGIDSFSYGNADGFGCHPSKGGTGNVFREDRAWNNSDDGYDTINCSETVVFDHCWSYKNGNNGGNGNGFKIGGWASTVQNRIANPLPVHMVEFCLSACNSSHGYYANHQPGQAANWTNNTSYDNSTDFDMLERTAPDYSSTVAETNTNDIAGVKEVMHLNLAFSGTLTGDLNESGAIVSNNSWTENISLNNGDFESVACSAITQARNSDGSLPNITFMHPVSASPAANLGCFPLTITNTPVPPTATKTNTPVPPTSTKTNTPVPTSTFTATRTNTPPSTATFTLTRTNTATNTPTKTNTLTFTFTPTSTSTATRTNTLIPPTSTPTPTATRTLTPLPPTATFTGTNTPAVPTSTFMVTPTPTLTPVSGQVVIQAENNCGFSGTIDSNHLGFTGVGFTNLTNNNTAGITFALNSTTAQTLTITFRYSDGTTTARPMLLSRVSPTVSTPVTVNFGVTTNWDTWGTITATVPLAAGNNLISLVPTGTNTNGGPNLDELTFTSSTVTVGNCSGTASAMLLSSVPNTSQLTTTQVVAAPNTSRNGSPIQFQVTLGQSAEIQLSLFTVTGEKVFKTVIQGHTGKNNFDWHLEDQAGSTVASGLYVYLIRTNPESGSGQFTGKVIVVH